MSIIDAIIMLECEYYHHTGVHPTRVYLGEKEYTELQNCLKEHDKDFYDEIVGLKVFVVKGDEPHMRVCS